MNSFNFVVLLILVFAYHGEAFRKFNTVPRSTGTALSMRPLAESDVKLFKGLAPIMTVAIQTVPLAAFAADGGNTNPFIYPLVISVLTMVPFLWYQQQLAPKPRVAKQIELDENLRPVNKAEISAGREGTARAAKKK
eukprot:gene1376-1457_t